MRDRIIGWMAVAVVASFVAQFTVGVTTPTSPLSRTFALGTLNALAWYGLTALAAVWLLRRHGTRGRPALAIVAGQGILALPGIVFLFSGDRSPLPTWLVVSLVGDAVIVTAGALAVWSLTADGVRWRLWSWDLNRMLILGATALLALSERMPRFDAPQTAPLIAGEVSFLSRIVTGPLPWRLTEILSLVVVLAVGFAASTLRSRELAVAVGATLAVPAVPELLSLVIDPASPAAASGTPTAWLWAQTGAVALLALSLVFLATGGARPDGSGAAVDAPA